MTDLDLEQLLEQYRAGLDAELTILRRLENTAARQRQATTEHDLLALRDASDDRDRLMSALVTIENEVRSVRQTLSHSREQARRLPGYAEAAALHRQALALVSAILKTDGESVEALAAAELVRREVAQAVEQGETTLAAYRRVMTTAPGAMLVDRRG